MSVCMYATNVTVALRVSLGPSVRSERSFETDASLDLTSLHFEGAERAGGSRWSRPSLLLRLLSCDVPRRGAMKCEIKNWHAVASWTWTTEDDVCGICHMPLDGCAPGAAGPGDDSPVVWGRVRAAPRGWEVEPPTILPPLTSYFPRAPSPRSALTTST